MSVWVLLRGLTRERGHWGGFPRQLAERVSPARIVALDLPGNGVLHHQCSPARVPDMIAPCRAQLQALGLPGPYCLVAMSLGAMVAIAWADACPDEVEGCVLINTSVRPFSPVHRRLSPSSYLPLFRLLASRDDHASEAIILGLTSRTRPAAVLDDWVALRRNHRVSRLNALRQLVAAARFRAPARPPAVPMLILSGAADALVDPRCSEALAARWSLPLVQHATGGHDLPLDDGPWVAARISDWLEAHLTKEQSHEAENQPYHPRGR
ncbi:MAG: alpha/beta hydrolase [Azoarcus sp.]|nr:alpha/beta hydrolase [Azoarcus sp.]